MKNSRISRFCFPLLVLKKKIKKVRNLGNTKGQFYACERYKIKNYVRTNLFFIVFMLSILEGNENHSFITLHYERAVWKGLSLYFTLRKPSRRKIFCFFIDPISVINSKEEKFSHFCSSSKRWHINTFIYCP